MLVIELGNQGYLKKGGGIPTHTTSLREAREFDTKKQATRIIERLKKSPTALETNDARVIPLNKSLYG
jgi:hypothetical protein